MTRSVEAGTLSFWTAASLAFYLLALLAGRVSGEHNRRED